MATNKKKNNNTILTIFFLSTTILSGTAGFFIGVSQNKPSTVIDNKIDLSSIIQVTNFGKIKELGETKPSKENIIEAGKIVNPSENILGEHIMAFDITESSAVLKPIQNDLNYKGQIKISFEFDNKDDISEIITDTTIGDFEPASGGDMNRVKEQLNVKLQDRNRALITNDLNLDIDYQIIEIQPLSFIVKGIGEKLKGQVTINVDIRNDLTKYIILSDLPKITAADRTNIISAIVSRNPNFKNWSTTNNFEITNITESSATINGINFLEGSRELTFMIGYDIKDIITHTILGHQLIRNLWDINGRIPQLKTIIIDSEPLITEKGFVYGVDYIIKYDSEINPKQIEVQGISELLSGSTTISIDISVELKYIVPEINLGKIPNNDILTIKEYLGLKNPEIAEGNKLENTNYGVTTIKSNSATIYGYKLLNGSLSINFSL